MFLNPTFFSYTTVGGFIFMGTDFRGLNKNHTFVGFKIRGLSTKPTKLVPHEN